jgi:predicted TIM-barrel fold metal-dependent hydrolase
MAEAYGKSPQSFERDPLDAFREHVWVTPFYEDAIARLVPLLGADHVLMGSDWPHPEGLSTPIAFADDVVSLPADTRRRILRDNLRALVGHGT